MVSIEISNVRKEFGAVSVLKGINLSIASGEFAVLVGPSGCGKSTLLRLIAGLDEASSGDVLIGGRRVNNLPPRDRDIAMVFQSYALYPHMNVHDNMAYSLKLKRTPTARIAEAVAMAASKLGLETLVARKPRELSGGQRQRVAMGRAIVRNPTAFLFDEPLSNLDARMREQMRFEIRKLHRELGATSVYVTHDQIEAMTMADRIVAMDAGVIQQVGTPLELYDDPANMFVAAFIGSPAMNFLDARARRGEGGTAISVGGAAFCTLPQSLALPDDTRVTIGIRPERITIGARPSPSVEAVVDLVETTGPANIIHVDLAGQAMKIFTTERLQLVHGQRVPLAFDPAHVCLFDGASGIRLR